MADTKISALTDIVTLAAGDKIPVADASDLTVTKSTTTAQVATYVLNNAQPTTDSTYTLGTSSLYWSNTYSDRYYLNSTAYLDGSVAGTITVSDASPISLGTATDVFSTAIKVNRNSILVGQIDNNLSGLRLKAVTNSLQLANNTATIIGISGAGLITVADASDIALGTTTGTKFGTATTQKLGFFNATPVVQPAAYTPSNVTTDRTFDANATTLDEVADVLGTLIADLKSLGLVG